jgi:hypothetical protein
MLCRQERNSLPPNAFSKEKGGKLGLSETDNMKDSVAEWHDYKDIFVSLPHQTKLRAI